MQLTETTIDISILPEVFKKEIISYYHNVLKKYHASKSNNQVEQLVSNKRFSNFFNESNQINHLNTFSREVMHER